MSEPKLLHAGVNMGASDPEANAEAEPVMFGFWVFLMSDLLLFALLLATYATMTTHGVAGGPAPKDIVDLRSAGAETALLLASSFTFGMASLAMKYRQDAGRVLVWMAITGVLGAGFLVFESLDFMKLTGEGSVPQRSGLLSAHFTVLGMHFFHVSAGIAWMVVMAVQLKVFGLCRSVQTRIMRLALFWHMLDIVWVALFSFVFLAGAAS